MAHAQSGRGAVLSVRPLAPAYSIRRDATKSRIAPKTTRGPQRLTSAGRFPLRKPEFLLTPVKIQRRHSPTLREPHGLTGTCGQTRRYLTPAREPDAREELSTAGQRQFEGSQRHSPESMFTADQIVAHLVGDYILQSHWMATEKTKQSTAAAIHAVTYTLPFVLITQSIAALAIICGTHFLIDRFRLARFVVWFKNGPLQRNGGWTETEDDRGVVDRSYQYELKPFTATGYADDVPPWLAVWLLIWADNTLHIIINGLAIWAAT